MDIIQLVESMNESMYLRLKHAAETGKWPEGTVVDQPQRDSALQIVMAYQAKHLDSSEMLTVGADGEIVTESKSDLKKKFSEHNNIARFSDI
jgi:uncharacterized protein YeaC (DUF1315 family)